MGFFRAAQPLDIILMQTHAAVDQRGGGLGQAAVRLGQDGMDERIMRRVRDQAVILQTLADALI